MKMKTKKGGVFAALTAVLFITAALVTSCPEPLNLIGFTPPKVEEQASSVSPEGNTILQPPAGNTVSQPAEGKTVSQPEEGNTVSQPEEGNTVFQIPEGSTVIQTPEGNTVIQTSEGDIIFQLPEEDTDLLPPEEVGYLRLNIATKGGEARTIRPNTSALATLSGFDSFDIYILQTNGTTVVGTPKTGILLAAVDSPVTVAAGSYKVRVFGNKGGKAVATGISDTVVVTSGTDNAASITLSEIVGSITVGTATHGDGTFTWALSNSDGVETAIMTITPLSTDGTDDYDATNGPYGDLVALGKLTDTTGVELKSGYYRVSIALEKTGTKSETQMTILHIYQGLTSNYAGALKTLKPNRYTVTFYYNDGHTDDPTPPAEYDTLANTLHGTTVSAPVTDPGNRAHSTYLFDGWHTAATSQSTSTLFNFSTTIIRDTDLYAKWIDPASIGITVDLEDDVDWAEDKSPQMSASVTTWNRNTTSGTITITVTNAATFSSLTWYLDGDHVTPAGSGTTFTFDFTSSDAYKILGVYTIYLEGVTSGTPDDIPWSSEVTITVTGS